MYKGKNKVYIIILSLIVLGGVILLVSDKNTSGGEQSGVETNNSDSSVVDGKELVFKQAIGEQAPNFNLESSDGKVVTLSDYRGKVVVLFFNEGSMCYPACWNQIEEFSKDERFNSDDVVVFSVVIDPKSKWEKIFKKTQIFSDAKILFDTTKAVSVAYDVLSLQSSMHPRTNPGHTYFIIDREGTVRYTFDDPNMAIRNDTIFSEISKIIGE